MNATEITMWLGVAYAVLNGSATIITIITPTPAPDSRLGKTYRIIEVLAGLVGRAKDPGPQP